MNEAEALGTDMAVARSFTHRSGRTDELNRRMPGWVRWAYDWAGAACLRYTTACRECSGGGMVANGHHGETKNASRRIICQACHGSGRTAA